MPTVTFNTIGELVTYINQFIKVNDNNEITGEQHNNVENGLVDFIISSPENYNRANVTATASSFVAVASQCVLIFKSGATGSVRLTDNKWNEWVVYNNSGANKTLVGSISSYKTNTGVTKNYFSNETVTHLAKGNDNVWYQVDNGAGGGSSITGDDGVIVESNVAKITGRFDTVDEFATYDKSTTQISVADPVRGGLFNLYTGSDAADEYMVFEDAIGRKWQRFVQDTTLNARWFKFNAFNTALSNAQNDMAPYMRAMLDYVNTHPKFTEIYIPEDKRTPDLGYFFLTRVTLDAKVKIRGDGATNYPKTKLLAWVDTGLFFQPYLKADGDVTNTQLENLNMSASTSTDITVPLFETRAQTHWRNVRIEGTGGNGGNCLSIIALADPGPLLGNADRSSFYNCSFNQGYNGTYLYGQDANKITFYDCEWIGNRRWGLWDNGFLGNTVYSPHFAFNGANGINSNSVVSYGGSYYVCLTDEGSSNINQQPDISPTYWHEMVGGGAASTPWNSATIYLSGGPYAVTDLNSWSKCYDIYTECGQPPSKLNTRSEMTAGDNCAGVIYSTGGVYKYILSSVETQTGSKEYITPNSHVSIGAARPGGNTSALYMEISNGNPTSIHANALGPFCSIKLNQSADAGIPALIAYSGGARYLNFYPGNTLVMQLQESLGMLPGANNTFDLGMSGQQWKDIWGQTYYGSGASLTGVTKPADLDAKLKTGSFSQVGAATTTFTVTIGVTEPDANYRVNVTPTAALSAALFYVTNKTTTTFDVVYLAGLTGPVTFDWAVAY